MASYEFATPTQTTAPVAGTTAGLYTCASPSRVLSIYQYTGQTCYLRFNSASAASATAGAYDVALESRETSWVLDAETLGIHTINTVSVWVPATGTVSLLALRVA